MGFAVMFLSAFLVASTLSAAGAKGDTAADSKVVELTDATLDEAIEATGGDQHGVLLIEFYAPWCGHCKSLAPEYEAAAKLLAFDGHEGVLAKLDATASKSEIVGVKGYPTMLLFRGGENIGPYEGQRSAQAIAAHVQSHIESISLIDEAGKIEAAKECGDDACASCKDEEACGNFECLWDDDSGKGCGPRFVSLFGHKIDLLEVKERQKDSGQAQDANVADRPEL